MPKTKIACPHCQTAVLVDPAAGNRFTCPSCREMFSTPGDALQASPPVAAVASQSVKSPAQSKVPNPAPMMQTPRMPMPSGRRSKSGNGKVMALLVLLGTFAGFAVLGFVLVNIFMTLGEQHKGDAKSQQAKLDQLPEKDVSTAKPPETGETPNGEKPNTPGISKETQKNDSAGGTPPKVPEYNEPTPKQNDPTEPPPKNTDNKQPSDPKDKKTPPPDTGKDPIDPPPDVKKGDDKTGKTDIGRVEPPPPLRTGTKKPKQKEPVNFLPLEPFDLTLEKKRDKSELQSKIVDFEVGVSASDALRIGIMPGDYDDIGSVLKKIDSGYEYTKMDVLDLRDIDKLRQFEVFFWNCGADDDRINAKALANVRHFVEQGGILYASDLRYEQLAKIFPEYTVKANELGDLSGTIQARVVDDGLKKILGDTISLRFDITHIPAGFHPAKAKYYLVTAKPLRNFRGGKSYFPLLAKFQCGQGSVVFTSFHNSKQINGTELKLLQYVVFAAFNAGIESRLNSTLTLAGFVPSETKSLSISEGYSLKKQSITHKSNGKLAVALGFRKQGAKLRLRLYTPDGKSIEHTGESSFYINIDDAPGGTWHYSVDAIETPYSNFPYSISVGKAK